MKIAVGFACLVIVAVLGGVTGTTVQDMNPCEVARGVCQSTTETCVGGELLEDDFYCGSGTGAEPHCCIPLGCMYGSKALRHGAIIKRGCIKLKCEKGIMIKDDSECQSQQDFNDKCRTVYKGLLLSERCFFSNLENEANDGKATWGDATDLCVQFDTKSTEPHLPLKLAAFSDITTNDIPNGLRDRAYWTGGKDTAVKDSWKWLDGKIVSAASIPDGCLSIKYDGTNLKYDDMPCDTVNNYICELPKEPSTNCICNKNTHGCTLGEPNMPDLACQCKLKSNAKGDDVCEGTVVSCEDPASLDCKHPGTGFEHCMQGVMGGQGNCCGYAAAKCYYGS